MKMKKSAIEEIEKEIDEKTKLPNEVKDKIKKEVFINIVVAAVIVTYFIFIVLGSIGSIKNVRVIDLNIFSMIFLGIAIVLFEIAYRRDQGNIAIYGIESLVVAIFTLFLPYIIFELDETHKKYYLLASIYIAAYYILKSIYIATRTRVKYMNSISDVKEIVKKEKPKRRVKDEIEDDEDKVVKVNNEEAKKEEKVNNKKEEKKIDAPKKRGRPKKEDTLKSVKENKEEKSEPKRRGRPKKSENKKVEEEVKVTEAPKKRGRPRKAVSK